MAVKKNKIVSELALTKYQKYTTKMVEAILRVNSEAPLETLLSVGNITVLGNESKYFKSKIDLGIMVHKSLVKGTSVDLYVNGQPFISVQYGILRNLGNAITAGLTLGIAGGNVRFITNNKELGNYGVAHELSQLIDKYFLPELEKEAKKMEKEKAGLK